MPDIVIILPGECTSLSPTSSVFAHGFGLFETMRYVDGRLYFWKDHWARLAKSAQRFAFSLPQEAAVLAALRELVTKSDLKEATLKISLIKDNEGSRLYVYLRPFRPLPNGCRLLLDATCPIFSRSLLAGHKTHNYMEAMYLLGLARAQGYRDTLRVDSEGNLAETTTANLFFVHSGRLYTPSLETGILPGVTRAALLRVSELEIEEGSYAPEVLREAEAVFVTNATGGIQNINAIDGLVVGETVEFTSGDAAISSIKSAFVRIREENAQKLI